MTIPFSKYHGTGNDFILIDDRKRSISLDSLQISRLCHRKYGIGGDGLIFLRSSSRGDFAMQIFNADGSEAEMCGNGLRCLLQFLKDLGEEDGEFQIETMKKIYPCATEEGKITVRMGLPQIIEEKEEELLIEVGVPHLVVFVDDLSRFDTEARKRFSDLGVNINYVSLGPQNNLYMRTFERGVEEETFSCGSGAAAACMAAWKRFGISGRVDVIFGSGESLNFEVVVQEGELIDLVMSGEVSYVYSGEVLKLKEGMQAV